MAAPEYLLLQQTGALEPSCSSANRRAARMCRSFSLNRGNVFSNSSRSRRGPSLAAVSVLRTGANPSLITALMSLLRLGK